MTRMLFLVWSFVLLASCRSGSTDAPAVPEATIEVTMRDDNTYEPSEIEFDEGQTIRFVVANEGQLKHEFLIGTLAEHEEHATQMKEGEAKGMEHGSTLLGVSVEPGDESDFTYTFPSNRQLIFGCHEPGHFEAGMKGEFR